MKKTFFIVLFFSFLNCFGQWGQTPTKAQSDLADAQRKADSLAVYGSKAEASAAEADLIAMRASIVEEHSDITSCEDALDALVGSAHAMMGKSNDAEVEFEHDAANAPYTYQLLLFKYSEAQETYLPSGKYRYNTMSNKLYEGEKELKFDKEIGLDIKKWCK